MRVLVTGANGLIGSHLVETLTARGDEVVCLLRRDPAKTWLKDLPIIAAPGDITRPETLTSALEGVEVVFHLAGQTRGRGFEKVNAQGTANLVAAIKKHRPPLNRFIFLSSLAAQGPSLPDRPAIEEDEPRPVSAYGRSKLAAEAAVHSLNGEASVFIIRLAAVYGPRDTNFLVPFRAIKRHLSMRFGADQAISLVYVTDVVQALIRAAEAEPERSGLYLLSDGRIYRQAELVELAADLIGKKTLCLPVSGPLVSAAAILSEGVGMITRRPTIFGWDKYLEMCQSAWTLDPQKIQNILGFSPEYNLFEGLTQTIDWYKAQRWL